MNLRQSFGNQRKYSYRELDKRQTAKDILFYLQDPEDAKTIFNPKHKNFNSKKAEEKMHRSFGLADKLIEDHRQGSVNLSMFPGFKKEIEVALEKLAKGQFELAL